MIRPTNYREKLALLLVNVFRFEMAVDNAWFRIHRHNHTWLHLEKTSAQRTYYLRRCECGQEQIKSAGPFGDGQWKDIRTHIWNNQWEWEDFQTAEEEKQNAA